MENTLTELLNCYMTKFLKKEQKNNRNREYFPLTADLVWANLFSGQRQMSKF